MSTIKWFFHIDVQCHKNVNIVHQFKADQILSFLSVTLLTPVIIIGMIVIMVLCPIYLYHYITISRTCCGWYFEMFDFRRFVTSSHLTVHIKQHKGDKAHRCNICGKGFVRSEHLKDHLVIHTGQKPHACTLCPKRYTQSSHLKRHMKSHKA